MCYICLMSILLTSLLSKYLILLNNHHILNDRVYLHRLLLIAGHFPTCFWVIFIHVTTRLWLTLSMLLYVVEWVFSFVGIKDLSVSEKTIIIWWKSRDLRLWSRKVEEAHTQKSNSFALLLSIYSDDKTGTYFQNIHIFILVK